MSPRLQPEAAAASAQVGYPFRGLFTIFFSPSDTFVRTQPRPGILPLLAAMVLALALNVMTVQVMGMATIIRNQLESSPKIAEALGAEGVNRAVQEAESSAGRKAMSYAGAVVGLPLIVGVIACVTYGLLLATGGVTTFAAVLGAIAWSTYAVMVVRFVGSAIFLTVVKDFSGIQPQDMLMLNASIFFDRGTTPAWLHSVASSVDLVTYWSMLLQIIGLQRLSAQVSLVQATSVVIIVYLLSVLLRAGIAVMVGA